jgi:hypothetical protein
VPSPQLQVRPLTIPVLLVELAKYKADNASLLDTVKIQNSRLKRQTESKIGKDVSTFDSPTDADIESQVRKKKGARE